MGFMKVLSDPEVDGRWNFGQIVPYFGDVVTFPSSTPRSLQYDIYIYIGDGYIKLWDNDFIFE